MSAVKLARKTGRALIRLLIWQWVLYGCVLFPVLLLFFGFPLGSIWTFSASFLGCVLAILIADHGWFDEPPNRAEVEAALLSDAARR